MIKTVYQELMFTIHLEKNDHNQKKQIQNNLSNRKYLRALEQSIQKKVVNTLKLNHSNRRNQIRQITQNFQCNH